mmetsp:Transcript_46915/g.108466  ORF Transcript_46915/g.108466 Transcript_46915/m.108466 type:complete len:127 (+) Transcript_46915:519-899(+)
MMTPQSPSTSGSVPPRGALPTGEDVVAVVVIVVELVTVLDVAVAAAVEVAAAVTVYVLVVEVVVGVVVDGHRPVKFVGADVAFVVVVNGDGVVKFSSPALTFSGGSRMAAMGNSGLLTCKSSTSQL